MSDTSPYNDRGAPLTTSASFRQLYSTLQLNEIRILLLAPGAGSDPIIVQLEVVASTISHQYEALSYVWGSARPDRLIECNHVPFQVTESLHSALFHLRYTSTWRRLWVDQICLDQSHEDELLYQLTMMGSIYSNSSRVVVWLGQRDNSMSKAWKIIEESCLSVSLVRSDFLDSSPVSIGTKSRQLLHNYASPGSRRDHRSKSARNSSVSTNSTSRSTSSRSSLASITRPLRESFNRSSSSLSSSTSSLSSGSITSNQPPRTPIRKKTGNSSFRRRSSKGSVSPSASTTALSSSPKVLQPSKLKLALSVFQHTYFTRLWTFQEVVLSPAAIFVSDGIEFALADLMGWYFHYVNKPMFTTPSSRSYDLQSSPGEAIVYDSVGSFENIMHVRHQISRAQNSSLLLDETMQSKTMLRHDIKFSALLMLTRQLQTFKAEDRVLSLLGLHQGFAEYLRKITDTDGWLPVPELFLTAFRYCVEVEQSLDILSAAGIYAGNKRKGFEGWPSWLPDWREAYPLRPLVLENVKSKPAAITSNTTDDLGTDAFGRTVMYEASDGLEKSFRFDEDEYGKFTFRIAGLRLGIVLTKPNSWPGQFFAASADAYSLLDTEGYRATKHAQPIKALLRTSDTLQAASGYTKEVLSHTPEGPRACEPLRTSAAAASEDWVCMLNGGSMLYILRPVLEDDEIEKDVASSTHVDGPIMHQSPISGMSSGSKMATHGDSVRCRFIGECAVTAFMDGSLASKLNNPAKKSDNITFELV